MCRGISNDSAAFYFVGAMEKVIVFIDGYNLYHAINNLKKPHLKWVNLFNLAKQFARPDHGFEIIRVKFFTAPPLHKATEVQKRYSTYTKALKHCGVEVVEGKFKQKLLTYKDVDGKSFTRISHEEKESDVNIALAILEDIPRLFKDFDIKFDVIDNKIKNLETEIDNLRKFCECIV